MRILAVCGSLQSTSSNLDLLRAAVRLAPEGMEVVLWNRLGELPLFNPDVEMATTLPQTALAWREALASADGVLIASPEYGHSLTGALKNAVDWAIGSGGLYLKPVATTCAAKSANRGLRGLFALQQTLHGVDARIVGGRPVVVAETVGAAAFERSLGELLEDLAREVTRVAAAAGH
jgi:chromate reductase